MKAVIKTGGKQYLVAKGDKIKIEKIGKEKGKDVVFKDVLLKYDGKSVDIGAPRIKGASVEGKIIDQAKAKKVTTLKYKAKKRQQTKKGHRQPYTEVEITAVK